MTCSLLCVSRSRGVCNFCCRYSVGPRLGASTTLRVGHDIRHRHPHSQVCTCTLYRGTHNTLNYGIRSAIWPGRCYLIGYLGYLCGAFDNRNLLFSSFTRFSFALPVPGYSSKERLCFEFSACDTTGISIHANHRPEGKLVNQLLCHDML